MTTQTPPESAEPAPARRPECPHGVGLCTASCPSKEPAQVATDSQDRCPACGIGHRFLRPHTRLGQVGEFPACEHSWHDDEPATPAPAGDAEVSLLDTVLGPLDDLDSAALSQHWTAVDFAAVSSTDDDEERDPVNGQLVSARAGAPGDAEVSHEQAREALMQLVDVEKAEHVSTLSRFLLQQQARQQQAEREVAELKFDFANACDVGRRLEVTLQGKDDAIAELQARLEMAIGNTRTALEQRDELSRKLEAAEQRIDTLKSVVSDWGDVGNWLLSCGWHLPGFVSARLQRLKEHLGAVPAPPDQARPAKPLTRDDDCPPGGHPVSVYASENGDTLAFPGSLFTTVRACIDCGVLINGGPTRCLTCADKPLTRADVWAKRMRQHWAAMGMPSDSHAETEQAYDPLLEAERLILATGPDEPGSSEAQRNAIMAIIDAVRERTDAPSSVGLVTRADVRAIIAEVAERAASKHYCADQLSLLAEAAKEESHG